MLFVTLLLWINRRWIKNTLLATAGLIGTLLVTAILLLQGLVRDYDVDIISAYRFDRTGEGYTRAIYTFFYNVLIRRLFGDGEPHPGVYHLQLTNRGPTWLVAQLSLDTQPHVSSGSTRGLPASEAPFGSVGRASIVPHSFGTARLTGGRVAQDQQTGGRDHCGAHG